MKALVIGGGGFIGSSLTAALRSDGFNLVIGRRRRAARSTTTLSGTRVVDLLLEDADAVDRLLDDERPDMVIHLASGLVPASDASEYLEERRAVLDPSSRLILRLAERGIKLIYFSSGGAIYGQTRDAALSESSARRPISFYGQAKREIEDFIFFSHRVHGLRYLILRPSNPYGGSQVIGGRQGVVAAIMGCILDGRPFEIWGDGSVVRDYIYIDDMCASAHHLLGRREVDGVFNIGSGVGHSLIEVVRTVEFVTSRKVTTVFREARSVDVPRVVLDVSKAASTGTPAPRPFIEGVRAYAEALELLGG